MSTNTPKQFADDEVDLKFIAGGIGSFFSGIRQAIHNFLSFCVRNFIWLLLLTIIGFVAGYLLDQRKYYEHRLIVRPNFASTEYLYSKVAYLKSIVRERDIDAIAALGVKDPQTLVGVQIKPVVDVYNFVRKHDLNFKTLELMADDGDMSQIIEEPATAMNYSFHTVIFTTSGPVTDSTIVKPLVAYLNDSDHYMKLKRETENNLKSKLQTNEKLIAQIDAILESIPQQRQTGGTIVNTESQLDDVIRTKDQLIEEQGRLKLELLHVDQIIKPVTEVMNIERDKALDNKKKYIIPFFLVLSFMVAKGIVRFYKGSSAI